MKSWLKKLSTLSFVCIYCSQILFQKECKMGIKSTHVCQRKGFKLKVLVHPYILYGVCTNLKKATWRWSLLGIHWQMTPQNTPKETPITTSIGPWSISFQRGDPRLNVTPRKIPKPLIATTSSAAHAAITSVGIP